MNKLINELEGIVRWPKKPSDKQDVIEWLSTKFEFLICCFYDNKAACAQFFYLEKVLTLFRHVLLDSAPLTRVFR